jgi:hypothetical protein
MDALELSIPKTGDEIKAEADLDGSVTFQLPATHSGWRVIEAAEVGRDVVLTPSDGGCFIGEIQDIDEDHYILFIELR